MVSVKGTVLRGDRRGTEAGVPTANIEFRDPAFSGIYAGRVTVAGITYGAAIYIDPARALLEAHLLDYSGDLYGKEIAVEILQKMRDSIHILDEAQLRDIIAGDIKAIREYLGLNTNQ